MSLGTGLILNLRPGFRKMIFDLSRKYEIVIFSKEDGNFLGEVIRNVDPY